MIVEKKGSTSIFRIKTPQTINIIDLIILVSSWYFIPLIFLIAYKLLVVVEESVQVIPNIGLQITTKRLLNTQIEFIDANDIKTIEIQEQLQFFQIKFYLVVRTSQSHVLFRHSLPRLKTLQHILEHLK